MLPEIRCLLNARPFVPFAVQTRSEKYSVSGPYSARCDPDNDYPIIFIDDDNNISIYGPHNIKAVTENVLGK